MQFIARRLLNKNIKNEIEKIGFDSSYLDLHAPKHSFLTIKIYNLKPEASSIIKQTALALGTDSAVHRDVLSCNIERSAVILSGSIKQLKNIAENIKHQPFSLKSVSEEILKQVEIFLKPASSPQIMGILNITEDSFSDGGDFLKTEDAIKQAENLINEGAKIIDIGAESTRPNAAIVSAEIEIERITPIIKHLKENFSNTKISIDTRNAKTAEFLLSLGADIINDVSGLSYDTNMLNTIKKTGANVVIMHSRGTPKDMDNLCQYNNVVEDVYFELLKRVQIALDAGICAENIIIDPGFGFAKNIEQNFKLLSKIAEFKSMGLKLLIGTSRKRFLKSLTCDETLETLDNITAHTSLLGALGGVDILRVHNVSKTKSALILASAVAL